MVNDVPLNLGGSQRIRLYSQFNGYGYSVKMSGFGNHIVVGAPGTEIAEIQSSAQAGTTTPGPCSHNLGEHMTSTRGPHYTGTVSYSCNTQVKGNGSCVSASHPYSAYKYPLTGTNALRYPDSNGNIQHPDRSPYGTYASGIGDGFTFPNFQVGNIRILRCPEEGSWSSDDVTQIGPDIKGRNPDGYTYLQDWDCIYSSFPGFGKSVAISVDGKRVSAGSPGYKDVSYDLQVAHGDTRYFIFNEDSDSYDEPMAVRDTENTPSLGGPWSFVRENQTWASWNISMSEDGSRLFIGSRESSYAIIPYDFSGTTFYPAGPIVRTGGSGSGPPITAFGSVEHNPTIITGFGYLSGYRSAAHNGASCVIAHPAFPEGFGRNLFPGSGTQPATSNGKGRGLILIYRYTLTSVFRGNSLFEGYVKCDNLTVGSSGGSVDHARIKFGGRKGENTTEAATTIESRWLGTHDAVYTGSTSATGYKHDNELLISKFYSELHTPYGDTVQDADWNKRDFFGDRVRIKAPKIEFQIQSAESRESNQKYRESPCVSITDMNNPFGGERGMAYATNPLAGEPRQLLSIRTGTSNSRVQAGLRLIAGSSSIFGTSGTFQGSTANALTSAIPSDGDMYTFAPGNDGWLRLLCPVGQGQSTFYQTETNPRNTSQTITSNYAGMAVGNLYVAGSISGPGASSGGGGGTSFTEINVISHNAVSGLWNDANNNTSWGVPKFNVTHNAYTYNDAPGYKQWNIPAGHKSAYISQLCWSSGGYADIHGVRSDGALVFLKRINTHQSVENSNHGGQHDGSTVTFIGTALDSFTAIRITNQLGRIHLTGLAFTTEYNAGTEGVGMIHSSQISDFSSLTISSLPLTSSITGTYGSVQSTGNGSSGWKGYSINGEWVFMTNTTECGIYNDIDNQWMVLCRRTSDVRLAYNGSTKLFTTSFGISVNGSVNSSDDRIKYNEESITNCLGIVKQLRPLKYEKLDKPDDAVGTWIPTDDEWESVKNDYNWNDEYGFVAQDVRNIPGLDILVKGEETEEIEIIKTESEYTRLSEEDRANYTYRPDTNDYRHNDSGETQTPLGVNYTGIIPILTGAIQELSSDLEQEKQKTENLQTRLTASEQAYQSLLERVVALENA